MSDSSDGAGCTGAVLMLAAIGWLPLHFSGKSILYYRSEERGTFYANSYVVTCHYFTSTGIEEKQRVFDFAASKDAFYCPRYKDIGQ
jgi:hypothetical protein